MKKLLKVMSVAYLAIGCFCGLMALADSVYDRSTKSLGALSGCGTWTNDSDYAALEIKRIWVVASADAGATITVKRITSDYYTQAVGTVICTAGTGTTTTLNASYLKDGDMLYFTNSTVTSATMMVEYEFQKR